jgi:hypothetical protein
LSWANLESGPVNYSLGVYGQFQPDGSNSTEFGRATFKNISIVPEPATIALGSLTLLEIAGHGRKHA